MSSYRLGPGILVTAAFIGPGTLTVCTVAGASYGLELLWAVFLSILLTAFLQTLVARLSWNSGMGLVELVHYHSPNRSFRLVVLTAIVAAIGLGNTAYEAGNITGALLGLKVFLPAAYTRVAHYPALTFIGLALAFFLWVGNPQWIKKLMLGVVVLMSISFLVTAFWVGPSLVPLFKALLVPRVPQGSLFTIMAVVGTTMVPYNLFLHAALSKDKQQFGSQTALRNDSLMAIGLGGLISMAVVVAASVAPAAAIRNAADLAQALTPLFGEAARYLVGLGLFAAGFSSALTAPLAAAFVVQESMGWPADAPKTKAVPLFVLIFGLAALSLEFTPTLLIQFAQWANALLLPFIILFLAYLVWRIQRTPWLTAILFIVFCVFLVLSGKTLWGLL